MLANLSSAQRREGRGTSAGNTLQPVGTVIVSSFAEVNQLAT
jgi:hypothetical protein